MEKPASTITAQAAGSPEIFGAEAAARFAMHVRVAAETEGALGVREISGNRITVRLRVSDEYPMDTLRRICDLVSGDRFEWDIGARTGAIVLPDSHTPEGFLRDIGEEGY